MKIALTFAEVGRMKIDFIYHLAREEPSFASASSYWKNDAEN